MSRRSNFNANPVSYGAVGASLAPDLLQYPPAGYWPSESSARLGSGRDRFESARDSLWQWRVQLASGIDLGDVTLGAIDGYRGLDAQPVDENELAYTVEGFPFVAAGQTAQQTLHIFKWRIQAPVRVVFVIDEKDRAGYALGTLEGHPLSGEEAFVLELREDDSVWFTVRALSKIEHPRLRYVAPIVRWQQKRFAQRFLAALHPTTDARLGG